MELCTNLLEVVEETEKRIEENLSRGNRAVLEVAKDTWFLRETLYPKAREDREQHKEFVKYCYERFDLKSSQVSKFEKIGDTFYANGLTPESFRKLDGNYADYEVVYHATYLPVSLELKHSTAMTLLRSDIKKTRNDTKPHEPNFKEVCVVAGCWLPRDRHGS